MSWLDVKDWFRREMGDSGFVTLYASNGKPNGVATIEVKMARLCDEAAEKLNGVELHGRKVICRRETPRDYDRCRAMDVVGAPSRESGGGSPGPGSSGSRDDRLPPVGCAVTPMMLEHVGFLGPITDSVYVHNLKFEVKWQKLKDHFRRAGNVIKADVSEDRQGQSRGFATVRFEHPYEALLAVAMFHNQPLEGREMRVRMDKEGSVAHPHRPLFMPNSRGAAAATEFLAQMTRRMNSRDRNEASIAAAVADIMMRPPPPHPLPLAHPPMHAMHPYHHPHSSRPPHDYYDYPPPARARSRSPPPAADRFKSEEVPEAETGGSAGSGRVIVRNIPLAFTDRDLEHYFAGFGQLKDARICVDANRRSLGYGFVEYFNSDDSKQACSRMNGYTIDGMPMRVSYS
ncbi:hypothetical protein Ciccas_005213 [Cichlidogyrus casuarinus]|uniref:RRM domain-containing protein n=1 Tax=Cichlidogyrus casuarinus TaxID=1844966 RepID=A0ABD2QCV8_9PLAT